MPHTSHTVKTLPEHFDQILLGRKTAEIRKNDRNYMQWDWLIQMEWSEETGYTGRVVRNQISHVLHGPCYGLEAGWVMLSLL